MYITKKSAHWRMLLSLRRPSAERAPESLSNKVQSEPNSKDQPVLRLQGRENRSNAPATRAMARGRLGEIDDDDDESSGSGTSDPKAKAVLHKGGFGSTRRSRGPIRPLPAAEAPNAAAATTTATRAFSLLRTNPVATTGTVKEIVKKTSGVDGEGAATPNNEYVEDEQDISQHVFLRRGGMAGVNTDDDAQKGFRDPYNGHGLQRWDAVSLAEIDAVVREVLAIKAPAATHRNAPTRGDCSRGRGGNRKGSSESDGVVGEDGSNSDAMPIKQGGLVLRRAPHNHERNNDTIVEEVDEAGGSATKRPSTTENDYQVVLTIPYDDDMDLIRTLEIHMCGGGSSASDHASSQRATYATTTGHRDERSQRGHHHQRASAVAAVALADLVEQDQYDQLMQLRAWRAGLRARMGLQSSASSHNDRYDDDDDDYVDISIAMEGAL